GRSRSKTINVDNNMYGGVYGGTGFKVFKDVLDIFPRVNANYSSMNTMINSKMNTTQNYGVNGSLRLAIRNDTMTISLEAKVGYNYPVSSLSMGLNEPYLTQIYSLDLFFELPFRFFINSDVNYTINSRLAEGFNKKPLIWNVKLSRRF